MAISTKSLEALAIAVLSVNNYPLEKAWSLLPALRKSSLLDPSRVVSDDLGDLTVRLARAGYNRGLLTAMLAERLQWLMAAAKAGTLDRLDELVAADKREEAVSMLCSVKGVGPAVARNAWLLTRG